KEKLAGAGRQPYRPTLEALEAREMMDAGIGGALTAPLTPSSGGGPPPAPPPAQPSGGGPPTPARAPAPPSHPHARRPHPPSEGGLLGRLQSAGGFAARPQELAP